MTIQSLKANEIEANWAKMGITNPLHKCDHKIVQKEYYFGSPTGDYLCTKCGDAFMEEEKDQLEQHRTVTKPASKMK